MTTYDFLLQLLDLDQDTKIIPNTSSDNYSEAEMRLFLLVDSTTVRDYIKYALEQINKGNLSMHSEPALFNHRIKSIVFHDNRLRKNRFYEITTE